MVWVIIPTPWPLPDNTQHCQETDFHAPRWDLNPQSHQAKNRLLQVRIIRTPEISVSYRSASISCRLSGLIKNRISIIQTFVFKTEGRRCEYIPYTGWLLLKDQLIRITIFISPLHWRQIGGSEYCSYKNLNTVILHKIARYCNKYSYLRILLKPFSNQIPSASHLSSYQQRVNAFSTWTSNWQNWTAEHLYITNWAKTPLHGPPNICASL
jgi:hypothetical protein